MSAKRNILTACLLPYVENIGFFDRNLGLLTLALRKIGVESKFIAYGDPAARTDHPLILAQPGDLKNPAWWKSWGADTVLLGSLATPDHEPIARAIKAAGLVLATVMDSTGMLSPRGCIGRYAKLTYDMFREERQPFPLAQAAMKTLLFRTVPAAWEHRFIRSVEGADLVLIETPIARQRVIALLGLLGRGDLAERVQMLPHPVPDELAPDASTQKRPVILSIGRWDAYSKHADLLVRVLAKTLARRTDVTARIIGRGEDRIRRYVDTLSDHVRQRFEIHARMPFPELRRHYAEASVLFMSSRFESFHLASAEALCAGCSVVGPPHIVSMPYFCSHASGTVASGSSAMDLEQALAVELDAWHAGERNAAGIAAYWQSQLHATRVATRLLQLLDQRKAP